MKILVSCVPYDGGRSGISVYIDNVVRALKEQGHELVLVVEPDAAAHFAAFPQIRLPGFTRRAIVSMLYHLLVLPFQIRRGRFDYCILCAASRRAFAFYPVETAAVVHDLAPCRVKGKYDPLRMFFQRKFLPFFICRAQRLFAISGSTRDDMAYFWGVSPDRITVNYNGLVVHAGTPAAGKGFLTRFELEPGKYILYVSRLEHPGKNQLGLIRAFAVLDPAIRREYKLVLAGAFWNCEELIRAAAAAPEVAGRVVFTGFIADAEMVAAYHYAAMYIFPSFYEGFGLSLLEAMSLGVPCACSETSSLGEIGHGAALLFDPADEAAITESIRRLLTDRHLRRELVELGKARAAEFTWARHAALLCAPARPPQS